MFARRLLRAWADWWRDICLFLTVRTQTQKTILSSLLDLVLQAVTATFFQRRRFHFNFKSSILFELNLQLNRLRLFYFG